MLNSTNDYLLACAARGTIHRHVVLADCQTAGRGQRGKKWVSPSGCGIYVSIGLHFDCGSTSPQQLSLLVGVAIIRALAEHIPAKIQLKWPNDIVFDLHKLGGVLLDIQGGGGGLSDVIIGIGINTSLPREMMYGMDQPCIDIASIARNAPSRNQLVASVLKRVYTMVQDYSADNAEALAREWRKHDAFLGKNAELLFPNNRISGIVKGVDRLGNLLFYANGKVRRYNSGTLSLRVRH